jgi:hypothetical protein
MHRPLPKYRHEPPVSARVAQLILAALWLQPTSHPVQRRRTELVTARRPVLAELIRQQVDAELVALLDRELDAAIEPLARSGYYLDRRRRMFKWPTKTPFI